MRHDAVVGRKEVVTNTKWDFVAMPVIHGDPGSFWKKLLVLLILREFYFMAAPKFDGLHFRKCARSEDASQPRGEQLFSCWQTRTIA